MADRERVEICPWCWGEGYDDCPGCGGTGIVTMVIGEDDAANRADYALPYWKWVAGRVIN